MLKCIFSSFKKYILFYFNIKFDFSTITLVTITITYYVCEKVKTIILYCAEYWDDGGNTNGTDNVAQGTWWRHPQPLDHLLSAQLRTDTLDMTNSGASDLAKAVMLPVGSDKEEPVSVCAWAVRAREPCASADTTSGADVAAHNACATRDSLLAATAQASPRFRRFRIRSNPNWAGADFS